MTAVTTSQRDRFTAVFQALPLAHKVAIGAAVAVVGLAGFLFFRWISAPSYSVLASGVESSELAQMTAELDQLGIPYEIEAAGTRVMVTRSDLGTARAAMATAGIDTGETTDRAGYELLDQQGLAVSSNLERVNVQRALEGELGRTLSDFERINAATVHLVIPDTGLFGDPADAEASVILDAAQDFSLGETEAVANLVASAVENLDANAVTIVDLQGRTLRAASGGADMATANGRDVIRTIEFEERLEADISRLLLSAGAGDRASVMVRADLNFDQIEQRTETFTPESRVAIRESSSTETFNGPSSAAPGGVAGVDGVDTDETIEATDELDYSKVETAAEYGVDSIVTQTVQAAGEVESIHIGVVVDDGSVTGAAVPAPAVLRDLISAGIGLDAARGDTIEVTATPFPVLEELEGEALPTGVATAAGSPLDLIPQVMGAVAILIASIGLLLTGRKRKKKPADDEEAAIDLTDGNILTAGGTPAAGQVAAGDQTQALPAAENQPVRAEVIDLVHRQPEDIAAVLRGWMNGS